MWIFPPTQIPESDDSVLSQVLASNSIYQSLIAEKSAIEAKTQTDSIPAGR